jgi:hypothetical protein
MTAVEADSKEEGKAQGGSMPAITEVGSLLYCRRIKQLHAVAEQLKRISSLLVYWHELNIQKPICSAWSRGLFDPWPEGPCEVGSSTL